MPIKPPQNPAIAPMMLSTGEAVFGMVFVSVWCLGFKNVKATSAKAIPRMVLKIELSMIFRV